MQYKCKCIAVYKGKAITPKSAIILENAAYREIPNSIMGDWYCTKDRKVYYGSFPKELYTFIPYSTLVGRLLLK